MQGGSWGLIVVVTVLIIGMGALVGGQSLSDEGVNPVKMGLAAGLAIILTLGPYGIGMFIGVSDTFAITDLEYDEDDNEISSESSLKSRSLIPNEPPSGIIMDTPYGPAARRTARTAAPLIRT